MTNYNEQQGLFFFVENIASFSKEFDFSELVKDNKNWVKSRSINQRSSNNFHKYWQKLYRQI